MPPGTERHSKAFRWQMAGQGAGHNANRSSAACRACVQACAGVRRETGDQGKALNDLFQLFADMGKPISPEKKFKELVGHTPLQVVCGAILGIAVGCALMQI